MAHLKRALIGLATAAIIGASAASAVAQPGANPGSQAPCFFVTQWGQWKAPTPDEILIRVNIRDIYRIDLSAGSQMLQWPGARLISRMRNGGDSICLPIDLQLSVTDGRAYDEPLIAKALTKLTPDEIAAIPPKYLP